MPDWSEMILGEKEFQRCGPGTLRCCAYLIASPKGFECARVDLRTVATINGRIVERSIRAHRTPHAAFPMCQAEERYDQPFEPELAGQVEPRETLADVIPLKPREGQ
jgi:hypothetical protein